MENNLEKCSEHGKNISYCCLNKFCQNLPNSCFLCIKNNHLDCDERFIFSKDDCEENLEIKKIENEQKEINEKKLERVLEKFEYELENIIKKFKKEKLNMFCSNFQDSTSFNEILQKSNILKNEYNIENKDSKILITPKMNTEKNFDKFLKNFEKTIHLKKEVLENSLKKTNFYFDTQLSKNSFLYNQAFEMKSLSPSNTQYSLKTGSSNDYYIMALKNIQKTFSLKITIVKMVTNERFLDIGLIKKKNLNYTTLKINENDVNKISFCGFKKLCMTGKMDVSSMTDTKGFDDGKEYLVSLMNGVFKIKSLSDDHVDLSGKLDDKEEYVFFITNYYPGVVFNMENFEESENTNDDEKVESS